MVTKEAQKWVYGFKESVVGYADARDLLGGKGAGVSDMTKAGFPVPPGFTITTEACNAYKQKGEEFFEGLWDEVFSHIVELEEQTGQRLGNPENPLFVSVRSGARESMPGMMETVLNVGTNDITVIALARNSGDARFAGDTYRKFIQMYASTVKGVDKELFEKRLTRAREENSVDEDSKLDANTMEKIVSDFKDIYKQKTGDGFPQNPYVQAKECIQAVFNSWDGPNAISYRNKNKIPHNLGTAVNVQKMVFGNMGDDSGTGVAFTRDPLTGERRLFGEFLFNAQGEDVVAGIRTPLSLEQLRGVNHEVYDQFVTVSNQLETKEKDMQDLEFTVERGRLWMLQKRKGKRSGVAATRMAVEMVGEGMISEDEAILRIEEDHVTQQVLPIFDKESKEKALSEGRLLAIGIAASPGAAKGQVIFEADLAKALGNAGEDIILVRPGTSPDDSHGMFASKGILTSRGGKTSHAAVVARGNGIPAIVGAETVIIDVKEKIMRVGDRVVKQGDWISIDGSTGEIIVGEVKTIDPKLKDNIYLSTILDWADQRRRLQVWANADYPKDAEKAIAFGAEGIGLCRTEHLFMEEARLPIVQRMIRNAPRALAGDKVAREEFVSAVAEVLPIHREDFMGVLEVMDGLPTVIRLIDPPLDEFFPPETRDNLLVELTRMEERGQKDNDEFRLSQGLLEALNGLHESNPMMGLRGDRLIIMFPEICEMQTRAIIEAACELKVKGLDPRPEIMVPLVMATSELELLDSQIREVAKRVMDEKEVIVDYKVGTMIETPRAPLIADKLARTAQFFSFGTNDLTQMTYGVDRNNAEAKFLKAYVDRGLLPRNPFQTIDEEGVGELVKMGVNGGRRVRADLEIGVCGEHGGDPESIDFFHRIGLNYVSASPFRVPGARIAAAQAAIRERQAAQSV